MLGGRGRERRRRECLFGISGSELRPYLVDLLFIWSDFYVLLLLLRRRWRRKQKRGLVNSNSGAAWCFSLLSICSDFAFAAAAAAKEAKEVEGEG